MKILEETFERDKYEEYLTKHIGGVKKAFELLQKEMLIDTQELAKLGMTENDLASQIREHDKSKYSKEEFDAYGEYFYGSKKDVAHKNDKEFQYAWLHHQHNNPHHWQHWLLKEDDGTNLMALDIPYNYVVEMICDWWSFSINKGEFDEIHNWYAKNKDKMILTKTTRKQVEDLLEKIKTTKWN